MIGVEPMKTKFAISRFAVQPHRQVIDLIAPMLEARSKISRSTSCAIGGLRVRDLRFKRPLLYD